MKDKSIRLFIAGDSTAATCPAFEAPMAGWGQMLQDFFTEEIEVCNEAMGGRSSNSFIEEGRLLSIQDRIQPGDYLFIQFGHNDQKSYGTEPYTSYQACLAEYAALAHTKNAFPVFLTSVNRRKFSEDGTLLDTLGDYPDAMRHLAKRLAVPLIDMHVKTKGLYESLGPEASKELFVWLTAGEHPNYPSGLQDDTHFHSSGAVEICRLLIEGIMELPLELKNFIKKTEIRLER
ncbi:rhamnogalacturonan acetylesterase [Niallia sp. MER 6]|uniref:rhamnogalacturonan acetylesterase n=1 Tax=Niallia sp. MER 6 TaxID=2939567 RepID=UPI00203BCC70|nr:rhamnogalacturonan acetylesterase [Niallia sp. MER 6]MCM3031152.1 rhamnogalacturonan acetylesterase [Niallia sp. MER 6]